VSDPVTARPAICLNMIVKNEAHVVRETLDSAAPYISSWVIVDTGSDDGTQDLIANHMARLGIPGELHERPWRNFGHNRTEALSLYRPSPCLIPHESGAAGSKAATLKWSVPK
jgi:glycosyltransferase involved in cell wall biosynthesis